MRGAQAKVELLGVRPLVVAVLGLVVVAPRADRAIFVLLPRRSGCAAGNEGAQKRQPDHDRNGDEKPEKHHLFLRRLTKRAARTRYPARLYVGRFSRKSSSVRR